MGFTSLVAVAFSACAATYSPPTARFDGLNVNHAVSQDEMREIVAEVLAEEGYTPVNSASKRLITTELRPMKLTTSQADCGSTMGISYLDDNRTETFVIMRATVDQSSVKLVSDIKGEYNKTDPAWGKSFQCVSLGALEKAIEAKLAERLSSR